jgi:hypothetical protein
MSIDVAGIGAVADLAGKVLERIFPDPTERLKAKTALDQLQASGELAKLTAETGLLQGQLDINKVEAASTNWFVAGWRPFVGWTCGIAYAYGYVVLPFLTFFVYLWGSPETVKQIAMLPKLDLAAMVPLLFGMLGIGGMRTFEKVKGAEGNR